MSCTCNVDRVSAKSSLLTMSLQSPRSWAFALLLALTSRPITSFCPPVPMRNSIILHLQTAVPPRFPTSTFHMVSNDDQEFSTEVRLRVEADSPFLKVRQLGYSVLLAGASISLVLSVTRIVAALSGINTDLMQESLTNAAVDLGGIVVLGYLLKRDLDAQQSKLKRASRGAELAALTVRPGQGLLPEGVPSGPVSLSALRRGRGIEKRVVIAVAGRDRIEKVLREAQRLEKSLFVNDLLLVPVVLPGFIAPSGLDADLVDSRSVALPAGGNWRGVIDDETAEARDQGVDVEGEGVSIVLKKNGRVGTRTKGIALGRMVGEVTERREAGMDVANI